MCSAFLLLVVGSAFGDVFEVSKVSFSSTVKESFSIPGESDTTPDPACTFEAFLSLEPTDVKSECIKNLNNGDKKLALSGRLFIGTFTAGQVDAVGEAGPELVLDIDCSEQNCNPGLVGGDDCKFDTGCSLLGVSTKDGFREMNKAVKLQFQKNKSVIVAARLPSYTIEFNLSWVAEGRAVPLLSTLPPLTPVPPDALPISGATQPSGSMHRPSPSANAGLDSTSIIVIVSLAGVIAVSLIALAIVCIVVRFRPTQPAVAQRGGDEFVSARDWGKDEPHTGYVGLDSKTPGYAATVADFRVADAPRYGAFPDQKQPHEHYASTVVDFRPQDSNRHYDEVPQSSPNTTRAP